MQKAWLLFTLLFTLVEGIVTIEASASDAKNKPSVKTRLLKPKKEKPKKEDLAISTFIMPVEGFLTQRVPAFNQAFFQADSICKGPPSEIHQFQPGAIEWLKLFSNAPDKKLVLFFRMPVEQIAAIQTCLNAKGIDITATSTSGAIQWINLTDEENRQRNSDAFFLPFIQITGKSTVTLVVDQQTELFLSGTVLKEKPNYLEAAFKVGKTYFAFTKFDQATQSKAAAQRHKNFDKVQNSFPVTEKDWMKDRQKLYWLTYALALARAKSEPIKVPQDGELSTWSSKGQKLIEGQDLGSYFSWVGAERIVGCDETDLLTEALIKHHSVDVCIGKLKTVIAWDFTPLRTCMVFNEEGATVRVSEDPARCASRYVMKLTRESSERFEAREIPGIPEFQTRDEWIKWIRLHLKKPTDTDPFQYYFQVNEPELTYRWGNCESPAGQVLKVDSNGYMVPECTPDVLYSWGPQVKLDYLMQKIGGVGWPKEMRMLFLVRSAIGTFGYGDLPVRVKLKPGTRLKVLENHPSYDCTNLQEENTFYLNYQNFAHLSDFLICRPDVIESWSNVSETLYNEMIADYKYMAAAGKTPQTVELYCSSHVCSDSNHPEQAGLFSQNWDGHDFKYPAFLNELKYLRTDIERKTHSQIYWNPSVPSAERTPRRHFHTDVPSHFHLFSP